MRIEATHLGFYFKGQASRRCSFVMGSGDLMAADSCCPTLPYGKQYLAVDIDCLKEPGQPGQPWWVAKGFCWGATETASDKNIDYFSLENHVQKSRNSGTGDPLVKRTGRVVVLGKTASSWVKSGLVVLGSGIHCYTFMYLNCIPNQTPRPLIWCRKKDIP